MRISDWSSDVCSSDLGERPLAADDLAAKLGNEALEPLVTDRARRAIGFGQRRGYSQLVAHEQRQRFEHHLDVAPARADFPPDPVEPRLQKIVDLLGCEPRGPDIGRASLRDKVCPSVSNSVVDGTL